MATDRTVRVTAAGRSMTLGEVRAFVAELDQAGATEDTPVSGRVTWGGGQKELRATAVRFGDPDDPRA